MDAAAVPAGGRPFVSRLIQNAESLVYVKGQLGHHSIKVTVDVYGHLVPGANKAAPERTRGATDSSVTPRKKVVELRGVEREGDSSSPTENEILSLPSAARGTRKRGLESPPTR